MKEKNLFDILENAENDSMERLIDKCPEISDEQLDRIFAKSEKKFRKQREEKEKTERVKNISVTENDVVEGVEHSRRPAWLTTLSTAASVVLIAGIAIGSTLMISRHHKPSGGGGGVTPAITVTTSTGTGTTIVTSGGKNGSGTVTTVTTSVTTETMTDTDNNTENTDAEFIKQFVGKWKYQESTIQNLDVPESAETMGIVEINSDATYKYTDNYGYVSTGTITEHNEEIGGTVIKGLTFSGDTFFTNTAFYTETRPYELHFSNSYIARLLRDDYVEQTTVGWKSAYRKKLLEYATDPETYRDVMWDLQDIDEDGTPELLISSGTEKDNYVYVYYYENGEAVGLDNTVQVIPFGANGVVQICKEEHYIGYNEISNYSTSYYLTKFEKHYHLDDVFVHLNDIEGDDSPYGLNGRPITEEEYNKKVADFNSKNWITVGRQYYISNFSPLLDD